MERNPAWTPEGDSDVNKAAKVTLIRGIGEDIIKLLAKDVPLKAIHRLIGQDFIETPDDRQSVQTKIMEGLKDRPLDEIESTAMRVGELLRNIEQ